MKIIGTRSFSWLSRIICNFHTKKYKTKWWELLYKTRFIKDWWTDDQYWSVEWITFILSLIVTHQHVFDKHSVTRHCNFLNKMVNRKAKEKAVLSIWVHPLCLERSMKGAFVTLHSNLQEDPRKFFMYLCTFGCPFLHFTRHTRN